RAPLRPPLLGAPNAPRPPAGPPVAAVAGTSPSCEEGMGQLGSGGRAVTDCRFQPNALNCRTTPAQRVRHLVAGGALPASSPSSSAHARLVLATVAGVGWWGRALEAPRSAGGRGARAAR